MKKKMDKYHRLGNVPAERPKTKTKVQCAFSYCGNSVLATKRLNKRRAPNIDSIASVHFTSNVYKSITELWTKNAIEWNVHCILKYYIIVIYDDMLYTFFLFLMYVLSE